MKDEETQELPSEKSPSSSSGFKNCLQGLQTFVEAEWEAWEWEGWPATGRTLGSGLGRVLLLDLVLGRLGCLKLGCWVVGGLGVLGGAGCLATELEAVGGVLGGLGVLGGAGCLATELGAVGGVLEGLEVSGSAGRLATEIGAVDGGHDLALLSAVCEGCWAVALARDTMG